MRQKLSLPSSLSGAHFPLHVSGNGHEYKGLDFQPQPQLCRDSVGHLRQDPAPPVIY